MNTLLFSPARVAALTKYRIHYLKKKIILNLYCPSITTATNLPYTRANKTV